MKLFVSLFFAAIFPFAAVASQDYSYTTDGYVTWMENTVYFPANSDPVPGFESNALLNLRKDYYTSTFFNLPKPSPDVMARFFAKAPAIVVADYKTASRQIRPGIVGSNYETKEMKKIRSRFVDPEAPETSMSIPEPTFSALFQFAWAVPRETLALYLDGWLEHRFRRVVEIFAKVFDEEVLRPLRTAEPWNNGVKKVGFLKRTFVHATADQRREMLCDLYAMVPKESENIRRKLPEVKTADSFRGPQAKSNVIDALIVYRDAVVDGLDRAISATFDRTGKSPLVLADTMVLYDKVREIAAGLRQAREFFFPVGDEYREVTLDIGLRTSMKYLLVACKHPNAEYVFSKRGYDFVAAENALLSFPGSSSKQQKHQKAKEGLLFGKRS